jgi:uncharacterized protein (DUF1778 family)
MAKISKPERLEARVTAEQKELLQRAADLEGRSLTDFVVSHAQEAALKTIETYGAIKLSLEESKQIADALIAPPEPNEALHRAAERHRQSIG